MPTPPDEEFKYWAFISYSHADTRWGDWLHKKIESYRVPRSLVGKPSRDTKVPRRLFPIFRDREELPVSSDLGANLKNSLEQSRYLIVICSPQAAQSHWVNEEVRHYKSRYGEDRLLCFIISGEPNSQTDTECFPPAVRYRVLPNGEMTNERTEPIAADMRPQGDGATRARFKLLAGLLGVNFDELWHRERRRRIRKVALYTSTVLSLTIIGTFAWEWASKEQRRRTSIAHHIEQGKNELKAGRRLQASVYFAKARTEGERTKSLEDLMRDSAKGLVEPLVTLKGGHTKWVTFAYFVDSDHVVTTSWDGTARLWDLKTATSKVLATMLANEKPVAISTAIFSPDRSQFVTTTWNGYAIVYNQDGSIIHQLDHNRKRLNWAEFSPDGQRLVTACDDWFGRIWTLGSTAAPVELQHEAFVKTAVFDSTGTRVLTGSFDGTAKIWDGISGRRLMSLIPNPDGVNSAMFSPDGKLVATACLDGSITLWDITKVDDSGQSKPTKVRMWSAHPGKRANSVAFNGDGSRLLTTGDDRTGKVWDVATGELLLSFELHGDIVVYGAFSFDGHRAVSASKDATAVVFSADPPNMSLEQIVTSAEKFAPEIVSDEAKRKILEK
jgi:hypothetical protein